MLDERGFKRKNFAELLGDMEDTARELYGADINVSSSSPLGIILRIFAWFIAGAYELAEKVYYSGFVGQAKGVSLDRHGSNSGIIRNPSSAAIAELEFTGRPGHVINEWVQFQTENNIVFQMIDEVTLNTDGVGWGQAVSVRHSAIADVPAHTITLQVEPTDDLYTITNPAPASGGAEAENDTDYRNRIRISVNSNPGPPLNGVISALLEVPGVRSANVIVNNSIYIDEYNNPPKSVHAIAEGGEREDIANALFNSVAAGIETVGNQEVEVRDIAGYTHNVYFDYAERVSIFVALDIKTDSNFIESSEEQLRQAVYNHIDSLGMGQDVLYTHLFPVVYRIPGVIVATVRIGKSVTDLVPGDISISPNQTAQVSGVDINAD